MTPSGKSSYGQLTAALLAGTLFLSACAGSATINETAAETGTPTAVPVPTTVAGVEPTAPAVSAVDPTAVPAVSQDPTPEPKASLLTAAEFRSDSIVGLSSDAAFAYAGTTSPWNTTTPCDAPAAEALAVVDVEAAERGGMAPVGAGLEQTGDVRQLVLGDDNRVALLSSCGPFEGATLWVQAASIGADGRLTELSEPVDVTGSEGDGDPYLLGWRDADVVEARVVVEADPDDFDTWRVERRYISLATGEISVGETFNLTDDDGFVSRVELTTAQGFTYRVIDDPATRTGCEGFGVARTLELDDGNERRLAFGSDRLVFSDVTEIHVASTGHIAWTSGCEGYQSAFVGKLLPNGLIADAHFVDVYQSGQENFVDYQHYRLSNDGFLVGVGVEFESGTGEHVGPAFLRWDLEADPSFVNTGDRVPAIDADPLWVAVDGVDTWHVGETLGQNRACGGQTLYLRDLAGFSRAFEPGFEIDAIVDADIGETQRTTYDEGDDYVSRTVVLSTICTGEYDGRRVWYGTESWGNIWFERADMDEVKNVVSVRDDRFVTVELFDGTVAELELVPLRTPG